MTEQTTKEQIEILQKKIQSAEDDIMDAEDWIEAIKNKYKRQYTDKIKQLHPEWSQETLKTQIEYDWKDINDNFDTYIEHKEAYQSGKDSANEIKHKIHYEMYTSILQMRFPMNKSYEFDDHIEIRWVRQQDIDLFRTDLVALQQEQETPKEVKVQKEESTPQETAPVEGHIYPVATVQSWTAKLKAANKRMDAFLELIDNIDPIKVDLTWLCKKCEAFCRRINHIIALIRYEIVKGLNGMYKCAKKHLGIIAPIAEFNPADIFACLGWVKNVINFFLKPYMMIVTFVQDFMTYTPELVSEAATLAGKVATVPIKLTSKIELVAQSAVDDTQKGLAQAMTEAMQIKMEPITMGDITGGPGAKPTYTSANNATIQKQMDITQKEIDNKQQTTANNWELMVQEVSKLYDELMMAYDGKTEDPRRHLLWDTISTWPEITNTIKDPNECMYELYRKENLAPGSAKFWLKQIFGTDAENNPHEYLNKKFSKTAYPLYPVYTASDFAQSLTLKDTTFKDTLKDYVTKYYKYIGSTKKSERNIAQEYAKYIEFIKEFDVVYPIIGETLKKIQDDCQKEKELKQKLKDQRKVTVFK